MKLNLQTILKMDADAVAKDERAKLMLQKNWDILNDEIRDKFKDVEPETPGEDESEGEDEGEGEAEAEGLDEKSLKDLISTATRSHISKTADRIAKTLVDKLQNRVAEQRMDAIDSGLGNKNKSKENDVITRNFLRALKAKDATALMGMGMKAIDTTSDNSSADAGFLIPEPLANEVIRLQSTGYGRARELFNYNLLTQGNTKRITALGSALSVYWLDEGEKKPSSQPSFNIVTLALKKLAVIVPMTEEVVEDSGVDLTGLVAQLIREAVDKEVDEQFFMGDGTTWTGIFKDASIPSTKLTGTDASLPELVAGDLLDLIDESNAGVTGNGRFLMHRTVLSKIRQLRIGGAQSAYLFNPLGGETYGTINGQPVELAEAAPTATQATSSTGDNVPILMYGDFKRGVAYGEKSDIRLKALDQATITDIDGQTVINLAEQDMLAIRAVQRVGFKVTLPGALRRLIAAD